MLIVNVKLDPAASPPLFVNKPETVIKSVPEAYVLIDVVNVGFSPVEVTAVTESIIDPGLD